MTQDSLSLLKHLNVMFEFLKTIFFKFFIIFQNIVNKFKIAPKTCSILVLGAIPP